MSTNNNSNNNSNNNGATGLIAAIGFAAVFGVVVAYGAKESDSFGADGRHDRQFTQLYNNAKPAGLVAEIQEKLFTFYNGPNKRNDAHIRAWEEKRKRFYKESM